MSGGQVKKYSARLYYLECPKLFGNRTSKNLGFEIFLPLNHIKNVLIRYFYDSINPYVCCNEIKFNQNDKQWGTRNTNPSRYSS